MLKKTIFLVLCLLLLSGFSWCAGGAYAGDLLLNESGYIDAPNVRKPEIGTGDYKTDSYRQNNPNRIIRYPPGKGPADDQQAADDSGSGPGMSFGAAAYSQWNNIAPSAASQLFSEYARQSALAADGKTSDKKEQTQNKQ